MRNTSLQKSKPVFVRMPIPLFEKCRKIAKEEYWNLSDVIREAVKYYLKNREEKNKE